MSFFAQSTRPESATCRPGPATLLVNAIFDEIVRRKPRRREARGRPWSSTANVPRIALACETANRGYDFLIPAAFPLKKSPAARAAPAEKMFVFWAREA